ncbi:hypothetical protein WJX73_005483 [Symbiochloris irregularis]|uniref:Transforming growth factor beta regulator 1 n=1 Tax=Symbiochloris irregularis TaxID=706552 RepID=A0AAW1P2E9_9CHLO
MFSEGTKAITTHKVDNLFEHMESSELSEELQNVIQQRVQLQRKMLEEYEKRETKRKVAEIRDVCPDVTEEEAGKALEMCNGKEDEAAAQLASGESFRRRVRAAIGQALASCDTPSVAEGSARPKRKAQSGSQKSRAGGARPQRVNASSLGNGVFVGSFRGRGPFGTKAPVRHAGGASAGAAAQSAPDAAEPDNSSDTESNDPSGADIAFTEDGAVLMPTPAPMKIADQPAVAPGTAGKAAGADQMEPTPEQQMYVLSRKLSSGSLRQVTDSELRTVRRAHGLCSPDALPEQQPSAAETAAAAAVEGKEPEQPANAKGKAQLPAATRPARRSAASRKRPHTPDDIIPDAPSNVAISSDEEEDAEIVRAGARRGKAQETQRRSSRARAPVAAYKDSLSDDEAVHDDDAAHEDAQMAAADADVAVQLGLQANMAAHDAALTDAQPQNGNSAAAGAAAEAGQAAKPAEASAAAAPKSASGSGRAISRTGHTNRGRVRQKSHKSAELVSVGGLRAGPGWFNTGYIFPEGFESRVHFRSSVALDQLCVHECSVVGKGGQYWPGPTFIVRAMDRADEPLVAKSCTGCWSGVLKRINAEIEARRKAGEDLPPPPKTAIAGPEYFGFNQLEILEAVEALDPEHQCSDYWRGKADREAAAAGLPPPDSGGAPRAPRQSNGGGSRRRGKRNRDESDDEDEAANGNEEEDGPSGFNRWSGLDRNERYRKRCGTDGTAEDSDNPLPGHMDPITFQPVCNPAISPWGHVMGLATWKAVLAEQRVCPFTKNPLSWEQCTVLSHSNIHRFRDRIKSCR